MDKMLNESQAQYCANVFNNYFEQFNRIDEYMFQQKMDQIASIPRSLPGMGRQNHFFNRNDVHPSEMDIEIREIPNEDWDTMLTMVTSHSNMTSIPGKALKLAVVEKNSNKYLGFIRFGSPVINCRPRNILLGGVPDLSNFNKTSIMGFAIVPVQPFGFNYLGGKLLSAICCSHFIREKLNKKYNMNLVMFETTSLYGTSKAASQYDGMKPFLRNRGLTDSDFIPLIHGDDYRSLLNYIEDAIGEPIVPPTASSKKLKATNAMIALIKKSLKGEELKKFKTTIDNAKNLTEQKRYYVSNYGVRNYVDIVNGKTDKIIPEDNFERYHLESVIDWWKKKASNRYETLKSDGRLKKDLEVWTGEINFDIIR
jgi:hypothetical protein